MCAFLYIEISYTSFSTQVTEKIKRRNKENDTSLYLLPQICVWCDVYFKVDPSNSSMSYEIYNQN